VAQRDVEEQANLTVDIFLVDTVWWLRASWERVSLFGLSDRVKIIANRWLPAQAEEVDCFGQPFEIRCAGGWAYMKNAHSPSCICALSTKLFLFAAAFGRPAFAVGEWRLLLQLRALKTITLLGAATTTQAGRTVARRMGRIQIPEGREGFRRETRRSRHRATLFRRWLELHRSAAMKLVCMHVACKAVGDAVFGAWLEAHW
jgi:hypothetical protein